MTNRQLLDKIKSLEIGLPISGTLEGVIRVSDLQEIEEWVDRTDKLFEELDEALKDLV